MVQQSDKLQPVLVALETHDLTSCYTQQARLRPGKSICWVCWCPHKAVEWLNSRSSPDEKIRGSRHTLTPYLQGSPAYLQPSPTLPSKVHTAGPSGSGQVYSTTASVLGGPLIVLVSPKCSDLHSNWTAPSLMASSRLSLGMLALPYSAKFSDSSMPLKQVPPGRLFHMTKLFC